MTSATKLLIPLFGLSGSGLLYWYMNIKERLFVNSLGCGCAAGFNTNHLTIIVCGTLLACSGATSWYASGHLAKKWQIGYLGCCILYQVEFFRIFLHYNWWL